MIYSAQTNKTIRWGRWAIVSLLSLSVVVNPFSHTTTIKEICFYGSLLAAIVLFAAGKRDFFARPTPLLIPVLLFAAWILLGLVWALDRQNTWHDIYSHLFRYIILSLLLVKFFSSRKSMVILSWLFSLSIAGFVIYALWNFYFVSEQGMLVRFLGNSQGMTYNLINIPIIISIFFVSCNAFTADDKYRRFLPLFLLIPLVAALVLTQARSAFLAVSLAGLFFLLSLQKKLVPIFIIVLVAVFFVFTPIKKRFNAITLKNSRVAHALLVLEVAKDHPLTGIGFGMETFGKALDLAAYKERIKQEYGVKYPRKAVLVDPHNMYTDILVRTGVPGFILFMIFVFQLFKMLWSLGRSGDPFLRIWSVGLGCSLVSYFTIGFFEPVFSHMHEFNFTILVAFAAMLWRQHLSVGKG
ncbi:O-antigen ligase family protein [Thiovibrio sp. JS02]